jgi:hypothetical protein
MDEWQRWRDGGWQARPWWGDPWLWWWPYRPLFPPGSVPYRQRAWQPDATGWLTERARRHLRPWAAHRGVTTYNPVVAIDMNTGSVAKVVPPP